MKVIKALRADPLVEPHFNVLVDVREIEYAARDHSEILEIAESIENAESRVTGNVALLAKGSLLFPAVLLATHICTAKSINVKVYSDEASAQAFCLKGRLNSLSSSFRQG